MKKIQILGLALVAVFAFSAVAAASAFAENEWLLNGAAVTSKIPVLSEAIELKLADMKGGLFLEEISVLCSGLDLGTVGPKGEDEVTEILNLAGTEKTIKCPASSGCGEAEATVEALNLPWKTKIILKGTEFRDEVGPGTGGGPGYKVTCALGITDSCTSPTAELSSTKLTNETGGVDSLFEAISEEKPATCTRGGAKEGLVKGLDTIISDSGTLSVS